MLIHSYIYMKTLMISNELHKDWKVFCSKKEIRMIVGTELAIELAMRTNREYEKKHGGK